MSFGGPRLLDGISFQVEPGQRICLLGRNGEGKSTLLRLLSGDLTPDSGEIARAVGLTVARLSQKVPEVLTGTVYEVVTQGLGEVGAHIAEHHRALASGDNDRLADAQTALSETGGWESLADVDTAISRLALNPDQRFEDLSGGLKRRALLARALVGNPDVLLLDEPTNHLDIDSISWLEDFLLRHVRTLIFITHDRMFLRRIATRI
ncbi:MAG: ATP-binding cassette domain-containing protein, partial [Candidatus Paceibacterota bacterium]